MDRFLNRRMFLQMTGMSMAFTLASPALARLYEDPQRSEDRLRSVLRKARGQQQTKTLLLIFLRGGADGLNITIPTETNEFATYQSYRPTLGVQSSAIASAGTQLLDSGGADTNWALHPRAASLMGMWNNGQLAVLPDVHYDNGSRSHFDSQQFYDNGTPQMKSTADGWMNRYLQTSGSGNPLMRAIAFDTLTPFSMEGVYPTLAFSTIGDLSISGSTGRNDRYLNTQEVAYPLVQLGSKTYDREVGVAGKSLVDAIRAIQGTNLPPTDPGANYPDATSPGAGRHQYFGDRLKDLAQLIKSDAFSIELAEVDIYSWDSHNGQDISTYNHPDLVEALSRGISAFYTDLGPVYSQNVVTIAFSEFGRTSRENGSLGTDHGSATSCFIAGAPNVVNGRQVYTDWKGLNDLRDGRDLKHTTDYRSLMSEIVQKHMGNMSPNVFPDFSPSFRGIIV